MEEWDLKDVEPSSKNMWLVLFALILVSTLSFGLGRLTKIEENKVPIRLENLSGQSQEGLVNSDTGSFVGSANGTKYHLPWCPGANQIKEANKIWFNTQEEAELAGYTKAGNCPGL